MRNLLFIPLLAILCIANIPGCTEDTPEIKDKWVEIDSIMPNSIVSVQLDSIFPNSFYKRNRECLEFSPPPHFETTYYSINSLEDFEHIETCNQLPEINFSNFTLLAGEIRVPEVPYNIMDVKLFSNAFRKSYKIYVSIDSCQSCFSSIDMIYFWRIYSKLKSDYQFELSIKNTN